MATLAVAATMLLLAVVTFLSGKVSRRELQTQMEGRQADAGAPPRLRIINGCDREPMWVAHQGAGPDPQNVLIEPGGSRDFTVFDNLKATRYWPKFRCDAQGNACVLGESGGPGEVCDPALGCAPPVDSKFEATFGVVGKPCADGEFEGCDWLDMSLVDGFTVPFKLKPVGDCEAHIDCSRLSLDDCPQAENLGLGGARFDLRVTHFKTREVVGCYSPCGKFTFRSWNNALAQNHTVDDLDARAYCCPTPPESPESCRTGPVVDTEYVQAVRRLCPGVYGYAYDDGIGLIKCPAGTLYQITFFCPAWQPGPPPSSCQVGDSVFCPSGVSCAGDSCCPDGSTCPSAHRDFSACPQPKAYDCTQPAEQFWSEWRHSPEELVAV